jgi:hypothetical protein
MDDKLVFCRSARKLPMVALALTSFATPSVARADQALAVAARESDNLGPFSVLVRPGVISKASIPSGIRYEGNVNSLFDGRTDSGVVFFIPAGKSNAEVSFLEVALSRPQKGVEFELFFDQQGSDAGFASLLQAVHINAEGTIRFTSAEDPNAAFSAPQALSYQVRQAGADPNPAVEKLVFRLPQPAHPVRVRITEVELYEKATPKVLNTAADEAMNDAHFHPCSFSNFCPPILEVADQQARYGARTAFVFGLQHNLMPGAGPWAKAVRQSYDTGVFRLPFHYADPGARSSYDASGATPGLVPLNGARQTDWLPQPPLVDYHAWPVYPTTLADWHTMTGFQKAGDALRGRLFPFLSSLRLEQQSAVSNLLYGVCTKRPASDRYINEELLDAMDILFPGIIRGYAEYNLNKVVLFTHDAFAPQVDDSWITCMTPLMKRLADSNRPIGFHMDLANDQAGVAGFDKLMRVAKAFPRTPIIWHHGGSAPEAGNTLSAKAHIAMMKAFLATSPGNRYIDLSWPNGFFLRLNPDRLGDQEINPDNGQLVPRNWPQDYAAYMEFINAYSQSLMFGSDQVAVNYPSFTSKSTDNASFINHLGYFQGQTYGSGLRQELGLLFRAQNKAAGEVRLKVESINNLFSKTALQLMAGTKPPGAVRTSEEQTRARATVRAIIELQYQELVAVSGPTAPPLSEFMPRDLR